MPKIYHNFLLEYTVLLYPQVEVCCHSTDLLFLVISFFCTNSPCLGPNHFHQLNVFTPTYCSHTTIVKPYINFCRGLIAHFFLDCAHFLVCAPTYHLIVQNIMEYLYAYDLFDIKLFIFIQVLIIWIPIEYT